MPDWLQSQSGCLVTGKSSLNAGLIAMIFRTLDEWQS